MLPQEFIDEVRPLLGGELDAFLRALDEPPTLALRLNRLRGDMSPFAAEFVDGEVPWAADGRYLKPGARPGRSLGHDLGAFYLQEASAMVSASVLDAQPGEKILDLCAAPGGKTSQIAFAMGGAGALVSNEPVPSRAKILAENVERLGIGSGVVVSAYPDALARRWPENFDGVLVDAPCSGEGMFRREPAARDEWSPRSPEGCARRQAEILDEAARMVCPGGRLVYSTCTFNALENEGSVEGFLARHPEFSPEEFSLPGIGPSSGGMLRVWPHRVRGDGHFVARLRKDGEPRPAKRERPARRGRAEEPLEPLLARLEGEIAELPPALRCGRLIRQADYVHLLPAGAPELDGVKVIKPGLCLMRVGRSHIQPMHALAKAAGLLPRRTMDVDEALARRVLSGEKPKLDGERGWTLLQWHGLPVGFLKTGT